MRGGVLFILLFCAVALVSVAMGIHESTFNNYLADVFQMTAGQRGFLELPREAPGFLVVLMTGILCALPETRIGVVGGLTLAVGFVGLALAGSHYGMMMATMILASAGLHLLQPIGQSIAISLSHETNLGKRLGQMSAVGTAGGLVGAGFIWMAFSEHAPRYRLGFLWAAAAACAGGLVYGAMHVPHLQKPKPRLVFRKKFWLYYLLEFIFGARKQIFITFGPWVLIVVYGLPAKQIAFLLFLASLTGLVFRPLVGMAIDWVGERKILFIDGFALCVVCLGYGYAKALAPNAHAALLIASVCYIVDQLLFALDAARIVYLSGLTKSPQEITSTLAMGVSINHVASMFIPLVAGAIWVAFGSERLFLGGAFLALGISAVSWLVPPRGWRYGAEVTTAAELSAGESAI